VTWPLRIVDLAEFRARGEQAATTAICETACSRMTSTGNGGACRLRRLQRGPHA
jgi:hypothetical protein